MPTDTSQHHDDRLGEARRALANAIDGAEPQAANEGIGGPDALVKVGDRGLSFELRFNGGHHRARWQ